MFIGPGTHAIHIMGDKLVRQELPWVQRSTPFPGLMGMNTYRWIQRRQLARLAEEIRYIKEVYPKGQSVVPHSWFCL